MGCSFTITVRQTPRGVTRILRRITKQRKGRITIQRRGFSLRVIVNETPINLEETTSVLYVLLLIYGQNNISSFCYICLKGKIIEGKLAFKYAGSVSSLTKR